MDSVLGVVDKYLPGAKLQVKQLADKAKAYMNNMTDLEVKVMEATNHDPWGPHGTAMQEITNAAFTSDGFQQIMGVLDERLAETGENWRLVYKSLLLLDYMCKHGPMRVADALLSGRMYKLEALKENFEYKDPAGRDHGINVRQRASTLVELVSDRDCLAEERERAAKTSGKFGGVSSSQARYGGASGGGGGHSGSSYDREEGRGGYGSSGSGGRSFGQSSSLSGRHESSGAAGRGASSESADPVEATRQRIARLKAEGTLPASPGTPGAVAEGGAGVGGGGGDGFGAFEEGSLVDTPKRQRVPKKLSDVKVNPAISATFAKPGLLAPPGGSQRGGGGSGGGGSSSGGGAAAGVDLLGDLLGPPAPAAAAAEPAASVAAAAGGGGAAWDAFSTAPAAAAAPAPAASGGDWAAFESAAPAAQQQRQQQQSKGGPMDLDSLLGVPGPSARGGPLPVDAFADFSGGGAQGVGSPMGVRPVAAAAAGDPFAASTAVAPRMAPGAGMSAHAHAQGHALAHQPQQKPKLGPDTAKAKDPFADLGVF